MKKRYQYLLKAIMTVGIGMTLVACGTSSGGGSSRHSHRADSSGMYRVQSGDTLALIARANNVNYVDIMRWNGLTNPDRIEVGWRLRVRPNASGKSVVSTPSAPPVDTSGGVSVVKAKPPASANQDLAANPEIVNNLRWVWPVPGEVLKRFDGINSKGVVLAGNLKDPVFAAANGEVIYAGNSLRGYGNMIVIKHNDTWSTVYANNSELLVKVGDRVTANQTIARMGSTEAPRVQLYFEVRWNAKQIDPLKVLPAR
ncbi:peptidoglycan DD-metalloendopeptidase family protein [Hydromonas duriensis]|uniref:LysM domain-containing protein n=1 Tax=Hydromonas duriensis TaxID=1527608 RepID=A0A4R6YBX8_9BURK|nr:peptidoglycan DD-metalloendopeptidase family protein [Hydromonas duriensis]TDR33153.1 LysM domain-containing protein [Hydromonas duriensis]